MPLSKPVFTAADYWALPEGARAELIDGELWDLASPSRLHQEIVSELTMQFKNHIAANGGSCKVYPAPFAVNLFSDDSTFVEPDLSVICDRSKLSDRGCEGAPDLVVEVVSPSNPGMDYVSKLNLYREAGVREYWICDPRSSQVLCYDFDSEQLLTVYDFADPVTSTVLPGLEVDFSQIVENM
jgi:Uma2 family endonuclease